MEPNKSLDNVSVIANLVADVFTFALGIESPRARRLTIQKIEKRYAREGISFLTKTLPRLGKAFDKALAGEGPIDCTGFRKKANAQIPKLFGELFERVFSSDGTVLPLPCVKSITSLRQLLFLYYKYELPYNETLEDKIILQFKKTEEDVVQFSNRYSTISGSSPSKEEERLAKRAEEVRKCLNNHLWDFDWRNVMPRHGPGAVSTKEKRSRKYSFTRINPRISSVYNWDEFYFASLTHVCDSVSYFKDTPLEDAPARVVLVPKDSRGPRLISCEPLEIQWIQQGVARALVKHIESNPVMGRNVRFTDQEPNRRAALNGSRDGQLVTLDLKEASDRVALQVVEHVFPLELAQVLRNTRSLATILPTGEVLPLTKFAPMGSALCFPIMASLIWAILYTAGDAQVRKDLLVYGDDVIVPRAFAQAAIEELESFGLLVNRDKSCINGLFRESCGMDAYFGADVTPVRFRTVWSSSPAASHYASWISYANSLHARGYHRTADYIGECLLKVYSSIPVRLDQEDPGYPVLRFDLVSNVETKHRFNPTLQKRERLVRVVQTQHVYEDMEGWLKLLRYFTENSRACPNGNVDCSRCKTHFDCLSRGSKSDTSQYTERDRSKLRLRWR